MVGPGYKILGRDAQHVEDGVVGAVVPDEMRPQGGDDAGEQGAGEQAEDDELAAHAVVEPVLISTSTPTWMPVRTP